MKRKTNLFYTTDIDNHFLTFSNYTESMTGNFLATDIKLYPSKFLCAYIPSIEGNNDKRVELIRLLAARYENKLAFMRDRLAYEGVSQDNKMQPLGWLMDILYDFDENISIPFVGQVTEQDYNGIYADTICVIDGTACRRAYATMDPQDETEYEDYSYESSRYLYGWYENNSYTGMEEFAGPSDWEDTVPVVDAQTNEESTIDDESLPEGSRIYYWKSRTSSINIFEDAERQDIIFNVVIPLFDVINMYTSENNDVVLNMTSIDCHDESSNIINCPFGIWFSNGAVKLTRDGYDYGPSWSLVIGSQFKPFPYSFNTVSEISQDSRSEAFQTFASVLTKQNDMMLKFGEFSYLLSSMANQIHLLQSQVSNIATTYNIDNINLSLSYLQNEVSYLMEKSI